MENLDEPITKRRKESGCELSSTSASEWSPRPVDPPVTHCSYHARPTGPTSPASPYYSDAYSPGFPNSVSQFPPASTNSTFSESEDEFEEPDSTQVFLRNIDQPVDNDTDETLAELDYLNADLNIDLSNGVEQFEDDENVSKLLWILNQEGTKNLGLEPLAESGIWNSPIDLPILEISQADFDISTPTPPTETQNNTACDSADIIQLHYSLPLPGPSFSNSHAEFNDDECNIDDVMSVIENDQHEYNQFLWDGYNINKNDFTEAYGSSNPQDSAQLLNALKNAAKVFFRKIFSDIEISQCTISGRNGTNKLDPKRILAINRLLGFLKGCWQSGLCFEVARSLLTNTSCEEPLSSPLDKEETLIIKHFTFSQYRNQLKQPKKRNQSSMHDSIPIPVQTETILQPQCIKVWSNVPENENIRIPWVSWAEAFYEPDIISAGKLIFRNIFPDEEIKKCTYRGQGRNRIASTFDEYKTNALYEILEWMKDKSRYPYNFPAFCRTTTTTMNVLEKNKIKQAVFIDCRSQRYRTMNNVQMQ